MLAIIGCGICCEIAVGAPRGIYKHAYLISFVFAVDLGVNISGIQRIQRQYMKVE